MSWKQQFIIINQKSVLYMHFFKSLQESKLAMTMRPVSIELKLTVIPCYSFVIINSMPKIIIWNCWKLFQNPISLRLTCASKHVLKFIKSDKAAFYILLMQVTDKTWDEKNIFAIVFFLFSKIFFTLYMW